MKFFWWAILVVDVTILLVLVGPYSVQKWGINAIYSVLQKIDG